MYDFIYLELKKFEFSNQTEFIESKLLIGDGIL